jgi:hypothetical protein
MGHCRADRVSEGDWILEEMTSDITGPYTCNVSIECAKFHINDHTAYLLVTGFTQYFPSDPHMVQSAKRSRFPNSLLGEVLHPLIRPRRYSIRRHSIKSSIFVQRNHGIICRCVRQTGKEAHSVCLASELLAAATWHHVVRKRCTKEVSVVRWMINDHLPALS